MAAVSVTAAFAATAAFRACNNPVALFVFTPSSLAVVAADLSAAVTTICCVERAAV